MILSVSLSFSLSAESRESCDGCLSPEAAREDLSYLFATLEREHIDLFARRSKTDYAAHMARLAASIDGPLTPAAFQHIVQQAMAYGEVGHARLAAPFAAVFQHIGQGGGIIPLSIMYQRDQMLVDNWSDDTDLLPPGSRILTLGGMTVAAFEAQLRLIVSADTPLLLRAMTENALPAYLFMVFGDVDSLAVTYITPDGTEQAHIVTAMTLSDMYALQEARAFPKPPRDPNARQFRDRGDGVFYIQPGPFFATEDEIGEDDEPYIVDAFARFVDTAFAALSASHAEDLILDFRSNPGGDISFSDLIVARLVETPFQFAARYDVRAGAHTKASWADWSGAPNTLGARVAAALAKADIGERVAVELPSIQPLAKHAFQGRVWVLINKHSYSNAAVVAAFLQDAGIATVIGEESGDLPTTYGAVETFTLPNSSIGIDYPKAYMVRLSGSEAVRGVVPDIAISVTPIGSETDSMLARAHQTILDERRR